MHHLLCFQDQQELKMDSGYRHLGLQGSTADLAVMDPVVVPAAEDQVARQGLGDGLGLVDASLYSWMSLQPARRGHKQRVD